MKTWESLRNAAVGWVKILRGEEGWQAHFRLSGPGLATALVLFFTFAFLAVVLASFQAGVPSLYGLIEIMFIQSLWVMALLIGFFSTRFATRVKISPFPVLVPGIYALLLYLVAGSLLSLVFGVLLPVLWLVLGFMLYRLGRAAADWHSGISAAFAGLTTVLLVGLPMTLYMLATSAPPAA